MTNLAADSYREDDDLEEDDFPEDDFPEDDFPEDDLYARAEMLMAHWDDDPSPYDGNYSEE
jgi:hypothetical protein